MNCLFCGEKTHVTRSTKSLNGRRVVRRRVCLGDAAHAFDTEEAVPTPSLRAVGVRRSGDGQIGTEPFDRDRLFRDIADAIFHRPKRDDEDRVDRVVTRTVIRLERNLAIYASELTPNERVHFPHLQGVVSDAIIADIVEEEMTASSMRMQRVLYALSIRGRRDRDGRNGWPDASAVLVWINDAFPKLHAEIPVRRQSTRTVEWSLLRKLEFPDHVVKLDGRGPPSAFRYDQFLEGIGKACIGRQNASEMSETIARRVLSDISGQKCVRSSQLAVGVLNSLREVDDIAYLRWATILKKIPNVTEFVREATELISCPSPKPLMVTR